MEQQYGHGVTSSQSAKLCEVFYTRRCASELAVMRKTKNKKDSPFLTVFLFFIFLNRDKPPNALR